MSCSGACCAVFPVGDLTYAELEERFYRLNDGATIFDMVRPLTHDQAVARARRFTDRADNIDPAATYYRCVRWDEDTRLCTRYDERPEMCSAYPYARSCEHDCGYEKPVHVRFVWLAIRLGCEQWHWYGHPWPAGVPALTFPG